MAKLPFDISNPATYNIREGGLPDQKFTYKVQVRQRNRFGQFKYTPVTIRSRQILTEDQVLEETDAIFTSSQKERYQGTVELMTITDATRPASMGGLAGAITSTLE